MIAAELDKRARLYRAIDELRTTCIRYGMPRDQAASSSVEKLWAFRTRALADLMERPGGRGCLS